VSHTRRPTTLLADFKNSSIVGFSKKFAIKAYHVSQSHHTLTMYLHYFAKLKMPLLSYTITAVAKTFMKICLFFLLNVSHII